MGDTTKSWIEAVAYKQARQKASIPKEWVLSELPKEDVLDVISYPEKCGLLTPLEIEITNTPTGLLLKTLASGKWSSLDVTKAFAKRAVIAHQVSNCLTEIFIDKALARAEDLDEHLKKTGKVVGPLHGLPVSLKDQICIQGLETTMGYASWIGQYAEENATLVDFLYNVGAVLYVRTNVPQTLMWPETNNLVFGRTLNPYNRSLTSGGSSGGEGALIAMKGSPLGIGSDVGGSIRIPASFCGLYGMRPSYGRIPTTGVVGSLQGQDSVQTVFGPMSRSLESIKIFMKAIIDQKPWNKDPMALRKMWNEDEYQLVDHGRGKNLCFGIMWHDGLVIPNPPVTRALEMAKTALIAAGHHVVDWHPHKHAEIQKTLRTIWAAGSEQDFRAVAKHSGEPHLTTMAAQGDPFKAVPAEKESPTSVYELWQIQNKKKELRKEYLAQWEATATSTQTGRPIDAIIFPVAAYPAPQHGLNKSVGYTGIANVLDYPAVAIPVTTVDPRLDQKKPRQQFFSKGDRINYETYDPKTFENAPVGIQVLGRTLEDEALIAMAEIVDKALKEHPAQAKL